MIFDRLMHLYTSHHRHRDVCRGMSAVTTVMAVLPPCPSIPIPGAALWSAGQPSSSLVVRHSFVPLRWVEKDAARADNEAAAAAVVPAWLSCSWWRLICCFDQRVSHHFSLVYRPPRVASIQLHATNIVSNQISQFVTAWFATVVSSTIVSTVWLSSQRLCRLRVNFMTNYLHVSQRRIRTSCIIRYSRYHLRTCVKRSSSWKL